MYFTQYHFISDDDYTNLDNALKTNGISESNIINLNDENNNENEKIYRNIKNLEKLNPKVSLMVYSKANYLNNILLFFIIFLIFI